MQKKYARLTFTERIEIEKLLSHKKSYFDIASVLNRNKSTIQRDIAKQGRDSYKAMKAECQAVGNSSNRKDGKNKINACEALGKYVLEKLELRWSPRQISMTLKKEFLARQGHANKPRNDLFVHLPSCKKGAEKQPYCTAKTEKKIPW